MLESDFSISVMPLGKSTYDPRIHHRRSIRLRGYDYSQAGMCFLTMTTQDRACLFGDVMGNEVDLNVCGRIVREEWLRTPLVRPRIELDEFIVMPDHFHGILIILEERNGDEGTLSDLVGANGHSPRQVTPFRSPSRTVGAIVRGFKGASARRMNELRQTPGLRVWQRNYYERIVRDGNDLDRIRNYIRNNPGEWTLQAEYNSGRSARK